MNKMLSGAAVRARLLTELASKLWFTSKRVVVRRGFQKCETPSLAMIASLVLSALGSPVAAQGCVGTLGPCFQALGFLDPLDSSISTVISPDGSVVVGDNFVNGSSSQGFRWIAGTMSGLGFAGCASNCGSDASGANEQGIISGSVTIMSLSHPYSWTNGVATPLGLLPGGTTSYTEAIAAQANVIVGYGDPGIQAIVWENGVTTALPPLSTSVSTSYALGISGDGHVIVGSSDYDPNDPSNPRAVVWQGTTISSLAFLNSFDTGSFAVAANADGSVIVGASGTLDPRSLTPVRWVNGVPSSLGANDFTPSATDATGLVVSGGAAPNGVPAAIRWTPADGSQSIQSLLMAAGIDTTGWIFSNAAVNGNGRMFAGYGMDPTGHDQAFVARIPLPASVVTMHTHDFSGEGKSDLLWQGSTSGTPSPTFPVALWTMNGPQVVQSAGIGTLPSNLAIIGQRDFNGDGYADILWRDSGGNLSMWFMSGTQVSAAVVVGDVPNNWAVQGTGDLNGDGKGDLLWRDSATGAVAVWFMDGGNVLATTNFGVIPSSWTIVADDNRGDVLWQDSSGNLAIWQINGTQVVRSAGLGNVPPRSGWAVAGIGDFNSDGFIDILWRNVTGVVSIWFSNTNANQNNLPYIAYASSLGSVPTNFNIMQTGDYNGDGASDILWQDNHGNISIWFLAACGNVACVSSSAGVGNVGGSWTLQSLNAE
jgi:uncharacterized membrane protein